MNVLLLVVDSLRARSLALDGEDAALPRTPFLSRLATESVRFTRAYASECWTLPAHCSMFTGLLPSAHGAHFQTMGYAGRAPTVAEILSAAGYHTEIVTRNSIFDGSLPGITRGFARNTQALSARTGLNPLSMMLAMSKPRFRRQILSTGFFHPLQRESRAFVSTFARATVPADREALALTLDAMTRCTARRQPFFVFCNLYDVHAPYPPAARSIFRPLHRPATWPETAVLPFVLPKLGGHAYLQAGFHLSAFSRRVLLERYHTAIELADAKLAEFWEAARHAGVLDDTLVIVTSDHGEAFGEHDLYLHDASVYDVNLHVPLFVRHPRRTPERIDDVVSARHLFDVMRAAATGGGLTGTLLDPAFRAESAVALAEHFHYPKIANARAVYLQDQASALVGRHKVIVRGDSVLRYDLARDPDEVAPEPAAIEDLAAVAEGQGAAAPAVAAAIRHLHAFRERRPGAVGLAA